MPPRLTITLSRAALRRAAARLDDFSSPASEEGALAAIEAALGCGESEGCHFVVQLEDENHNVRNV